MKLNMICIKLHKNEKKTKNLKIWTFEVFRFFKNLKS